LKIGKLGVWANLDPLPAAEAARFAQHVESLGYGALWMPEATGRNPIPFASYLLANTKTLVVATGIANLYARDAIAMASAQKTLAEQSGGRFLLGIGVSHAPMVEGLRRHRYASPIATMRAYLDAMKKAPYTSVAPSAAPQTIIAALGPKMLETARDHADGAHPYNTTPEHTAQARTILGPGKLLCPELMLLGETNPETARKQARAKLAIYLGLPNYRNNWLRLGFSEADLDNGGSDRLIDAVVAWGPDDAIRERIKAHWDAGADHVCIQALSRDNAPFGHPDTALLERLAPAKG
jgi:probable F420-dependent oxidoreductase